MVRDGNKNKNKIIRKKVMGNNQFKVLGNQITNVNNLVNGLISYTAKYLSSVEYDISRYFEDNDVVIVIRIKNVAHLLKQ